MEDLHAVSTVFVVDHETEWRQSICNTIEAAGYIIKSYDSARSFLANYQSIHHGCLVLEVELPDIGGLELQQELLQRDALRLPIVFVSSQPTVENSVQAMKAGAVDFLCKPFRDVELLSRVEEAVDRSWYERQQYLHELQVTDCIGSLTPRERQVMELVLQGHTNKAIASMLELSHRTVELHRARVMSKMKVDSLVELARITHHMNL